MSKSAFIGIILAGIVILASASSYSQTIECDGLICGGSGDFGGAAACGKRQYMYKIADTSFAVPETLYIGTHDGVKANYTNVCLPAGWEFNIDPITEDDYDGFTLHGDFSTGPDGSCPAVIILIRLGSSNLPFYFGYDHELGPHDVGWEIFGFNDATENWNLPVGGGEGPVHSPKFDTCYTEADINGDGIILATADLVYLIKFVRGLGPAPIPLWAGDINADGYIDALDVILFQQYFVFGLSVFPQFPIPVGCDPDTVRGACCLDDTCLVLSQFNCEDTTGTYFDNATFCEDFICPSSIAGVKFNDINCDGIRDANEPVIPGWPINIYEGATLVASMNTDANGEYQFTGLPAGTYRVIEDAVWGWVQTYPPTVIHLINLQDGQNLFNYDFGNTRDTCLETSFVDVVTQLAGTRDNFVGSEPSTPDLAVDLAGITSCLSSNYYFDSLHSDECFAHTFSGFKDSSCCLIGAELCIRIKADFSAADTDEISFVENGVKVWFMPLNTLLQIYTGGADSIWSTGDIIDTCFDLKNLPPNVVGVTNILAALQDNDFSILFSDETEADFFELTVILCCPGDSVSSCCLPDGSCIEVAGVAECDSISDFAGIYNPGVGCTPNNCPEAPDPESYSCIIFDAECCDGKPIVAQRSRYPNFRGQVAVASCYANQSTISTYVVGIVDLTKQRNAPLGTPTSAPNGFIPPMYHNAFPNPTMDVKDEWTLENLGSVFGLALDNKGNIYVAATSVYWTDLYRDAETGGEIYKLDGVNGKITLFGAVPNSKAGIGNIAYDCVSDQLFVSNMDDGLIYCFGNVGTSAIPRPSFDHGMDGRPNEGLSQIADDPSLRFTQPGRRIWGLAVANGIYSGGADYYRLFYSVYWEDQDTRNNIEHNEIWSVELNPANGNFLPATARLEIKLPTHTLNYSNPVSDITFKANGSIILAERSMRGASITDAHFSRILEYVCDGATWVRQKNTDPTPVDIYKIPTDGRSSYYPSSAGGVDIDFRDDYKPSWDGKLWATGDALRFDLDANHYIYGLAGFPATGGNTVLDDVPEAAILIDLDGYFGSSFTKTMLGDVELPCKCCNVIRGDINGDGNDMNILDLTFSVDFIFRGGPPALCPRKSDINSDFNSLNILDLTFIVDFIFRGGQAAGPCD